jgi:hypothetical protein
MQRVGMKRKFPFCNLLKMTASEGRERDVGKKKLLDYSGRDQCENKRLDRNSRILQNENLSSRVAQEIST